MSEFLSDPFRFEVALILISAGSGILGSIIGLGGGVLLIPILTLLFGIKMRYAVGASLVSVIATSSGVAFHDKSTFTNLRLGIFLATTSTVGGLIGAQLSSTIDPKYLYLAFSLVVAASIPMVFKKSSQTPQKKASGDPLAEKFRLNARYHEPHEGVDVRYSVSNVIPGIILMMGIGVITGMLGIGCGALRVPVMDRAMRIPLKVSASTSTFMIGITSAVSAGILFFTGNILPFLAAPVGFGVLIGTKFGTALLHRLPERLIRRILVIVLALITWQMGIKTVRAFLK